MQGKNRRADQRRREPAESNHGKGQTNSYTKEHSFRSITRKGQDHNNYWDLTRKECEIDRRKGISLTETKWFSKRSCLSERKARKSKNLNRKLKRTKDHLRRSAQRIARTCLGVACQERKPWELARQYHELLHNEPGRTEDQDHPTLRKLEQLNQKVRQALPWTHWEIRSTGAECLPYQATSG